MRKEWPVDEQSATNQVSFRHRAPPATVVTVVAVIAHRVVTVLRHVKRLRRVRQRRMPRPITAISVLRAHHPLETVTLGDFPIREELRRLNSQSVAGQTGQTFDVELSLVADVGNIFCAKNKNAAPMRFDEVVTELVHENLIAGVDRAACDHLTAPVTDSRRDAKVAGQLFGRTIDPVELLVLA